MNCDRTGNPCGTDTHMVWSPCTCNSCFFAATGDRIVTPQAVARMRFDDMTEVPPGYWDALSEELKRAPVIVDDGPDVDMVF